MGEAVDIRQEVRELIPFTCASIPDKIVAPVTWTKIMSLSGNKIPDDLLIIGETERQTVEQGGMGFGGKIGLRHQCAPRNVTGIKGGGASK